MSSEHHNSGDIPPPNFSVASTSPWNPGKEFPSYLQILVPRIHRRNFLGRGRMLLSISVLHSLPKVCAPVEGQNAATCHSGPFSPEISHWAGRNENANSQWQEDWLRFGVGGVGEVQPWAAQHSYTGLNPCYDVRNSRSCGRSPSHSSFSYQHFSSWEQEQNLHEKEPLSELIPPHLRLLTLNRIPHCSCSQATADVERRAFFSMYYEL